MKLNPNVSSKRRKSRKAHFTATSDQRRIIMSSTLSKELRKKHNVRSLPIRTGDQIQVMRGTFKNKEGEVKAVYRKKYVVHVEHITRERSSKTVFIGQHPSNLMITKLHLTEDRKRLIDRKADGRVKKQAIKDANEK